MTESKIPLNLPFPKGDTGEGVLIPLAEILKSPGSFRVATGEKGETGKRKNQKRYIFDSPFN
jgi:hypothetical protein